MRDETDKPDSIGHIDKITKRKEFTVYSVECNWDDAIVKWFKKLFGGSKDETKRDT